MAKHLVFGVRPVEILAPELFGLTFETGLDPEAKAEPVMIGIHPEMAFDLAMYILTAYDDSSSARRLGAPRPPTPIERIQLEPAGDGIEMTIDLPERGPRMIALFDMPTARAVSSRLRTLLEEADDDPPSLN